MLQKHNCQRHPSATIAYKNIELHLLLHFKHFRGIFHWQKGSLGSVVSFSDLVRWDGGRKITEGKNGC